MNRKSRYKIVIDFKKSKNSYIFDKSRKEYFLDFFGQYASLAIGYNHPILRSKDFEKEIKYVSKQKIVNNEILSNETTKFDAVFQNFSNIKKSYKYFHYSSTGSLAVEAAIKTAIDYKKYSNPRIISFKGSFHGINSYGGILSDRFGSVKDRLEGFPGSYWEKFDNPIISYKNNKKYIDENRIRKVINNIETLLKSKNRVCAIIIEPIQCTNGDQYFPLEFFKRINILCKKYDIPLIFDEIQTGFCSTGTKWYFEQLNILPDILIFGKKTQSSGIMVKKKFGDIFNKPIRLEVTWDGDAIDMVRCKYIIKAYKEFKVLNNVKTMSEIFYTGLNEIKNLHNIRNSGLLFAFDLNSYNTQQKFAKLLFKNKMLCNPTGKNTIRLRPNLFVNYKEINSALNIINDVAKKL